MLPRSPPAWSRSTSTQGRRPIGRRDRRRRQERLLALAAARRAGAAARRRRAASSARRQLLQEAALADAVALADARDPVALAAAVEAAGGPADVTVVCVDVPGCEHGAVLATADRGTVIFFSMATSFSAAALGAEGLAADVTMMIGNGYAARPRRLRARAAATRPASAVAVRASGWPAHAALTTGRPALAAEDALPRGGLQPGGPFATASLWTAPVAWVGSDEAADAQAAHVPTTSSSWRARSSRPAFVDAHVHVTETGLAARRRRRPLRPIAGRSSRRSSAPPLRRGPARARPRLGRAGPGRGPAADARPSSTGRRPAAWSTSPGSTRTAPSSPAPWRRPPARATTPAGPRTAGSSATRTTPSARRRARADVLCQGTRPADGAAGGRRRRDRVLHEMSAPHIAPEGDLGALMALAGADHDGELLPEVVPYRGDLVADEARPGRSSALGVPLAGLAGDLNADGAVGSRTASCASPMPTRRPPPATPTSRWSRSATTSSPAPRPGCRRAST